MFYIIHGYSGPDHYTSDNGPLLQVKEVATREEVEKAYKDFLEATTWREISHKVFRVIEGKERMLKAKSVVTEYVLE